MDSHGNVYEIMMAPLCVEFGWSQGFLGFPWQLSTLHNGHGLSWQLRVELWRLCCVLYRSMMAPLRVVWNYDGSAVGGIMIATGLLRVIGSYVRCTSSMDFHANVCEIMMAPLCVEL